MTTYICLPEVRATCEAGKAMNCDGRFCGGYGACRTRNKLALSERARLEAEAYGIKKADDKRQI